MGVLKRWFKKAQSNSRDSAGQTAIAVEPKPMTRSPVPHAGPEDQADRLRKAVAAEQRSLDRASEESEHAEPALDDSAMFDDETANESEVDALEADAPQPLARKPKSPRSKQELIEELHRNYQEVLGLIRKLDTHLDENRDRSQTIADVAEQYSKLAPVLESLPDHLAQSTNKLSDDIRSSITDEGAAARELLERIESAILHVGTDIERSTNQQGQLVETMAEFRESLTDLARSSTAAYESVRDAQLRAAERDRALLTQLRQTRMWLIGLTVGVGAIGLTAVILGIIALRS